MKERKKEKNISSNWEDACGNNVTIINLNEQLFCLLCYRISTHCPIRVQITHHLELLIGILDLISDADVMTGSLVCMLGRLNALMH